MDGARPGTLDWLLGLEKLGIKFGLENIRTLCAALAHPETAWPSVIVAGTNGKGSVAAMVEAALRAAGPDRARGRLRTAAIALDFLSTASAGVASAWVSTSRKYGAVAGSGARVPERGFGLYSGRKVAGRAVELMK